MIASMNSNPEILNETYTIEEATPDDAAGVFDVQRKTWIDTYPSEAEGITEEDVRARVEGANGELIPVKAERWRNTIASGERKVYAAKVDGKVVGFVSPNFNEDDQQYRIGALYVLPETQGMGVGHALITKAIEYIGSDKDIYLHVVSYNQNAINFYEKHGFVKTGNEVTGSVAALPSGKHLPELEMMRQST